MYSLDTALRISNLVFAFATIPASVLLAEIFWQSNAHDNWIRRLMAFLFMGITVAMMLTVVINVQLLFFGKNCNDVLFLANVRNFIKNVTLFCLSWGLYFVYKIDNGKKRV